MKNIIEVSEIGSAFTYKPNFTGLAVYKTLDKGQYAIAAKNVTLENRFTKEKVSLGKTTPLSSKQLFEYKMLVPRDELLKTLPGMIGDFLTVVGFSKKHEWIIKYTPA